MTPIIIVGPVNDMRILCTAAVCAARLNALPGERVEQFLDWLNPKNACELEAVLQFFIWGMLTDHSEAEQTISEALPHLERIIEQMDPPTEPGHGVRTFVLRRVRRSLPLAIEG